MSLIEFVERRAIANIALGFSLVHGMRRGVGHGKEEKREGLKEEMTTTARKKEEEERGRERPSVRKMRKRRKTRTYLFDSLVNVYN